MPEWSNGIGLGPIGLVPTRVRILFSASIYFNFIITTIGNIYKVFTSKKFMTKITIQELVDQDSERYKEKIEKFYASVNGSQKKPKKRLTNLLVAGTLAGAVIVSGLTSCDTLAIRKDSSPYANGGEDYTLVKDFKLGKINENDSRYQTKGLEIFREKYFVARTDLGDAMFKRDKSVTEHAYKVQKEKITKTASISRPYIREKRITGTTSIQSGEGGLFFIEPVKTDKGYADWVSIKNKKATIEYPKIIKKKGNLGIFHTTEQDSQFDMEFAEIPGKGLCYIIQVEDNEMNKKGFYNIYLIPVDESKIRINQEGKMIIVNEDQILRPKFKCWQQINKAISKLALSERTRARKGFEDFGMRADQTGDID